MMRRSWLEKPLPRQWCKYFTAYWLGFAALTYITAQGEKKKETKSVLHFEEGKNPANINRLRL